MFSTNQTDNSRVCNDTNFTCLAVSLSAKQNIIYPMSVSVAAGDFAVVIVANEKEMQQFRKTTKKDEIEKFRLRLVHTRNVVIWFCKSLIVNCVKFNVCLM